jgi:aspartate/methionine/tyrosine aminotransferase
MTPSAIRAVHELGEALKQHDPARSHIPLHFGEPDLGTPAFIVEAACRALRGGAVFYESNAGRADLREELARYHQRRAGRPVSPAEFVVTCGGVQAIHLVMEGLLAPGDDAAVITPAWPNFHQAAVLAGARVHEVPLEFDSATRVFRLDFGLLERTVAAAPRCRLIVANSPANPTGYVMPEPEQQALLAFCRARGLYLVADEMYDRIVFTAPAPPSFLTLRRGGDRLIVINGFSKTYCMTGWRLGYLVTEPALAGGFARMQEFITSHAPSMAQVAAITALREGEPFVAQSLERYRRLRALTEERLLGLPGAQVARPEGAFYAFFRLPGARDSVQFCQDLLRETGVMLAPGKAFGAGGEGWLRLCFAHEPPVLEDAFQRLRGFLGA